MQSLRLPHALLFVLLCCGCAGGEDERHAAHAGAALEDGTPSATSPQPPAAIGPTRASVEGEPAQGGAAAMPRRVANVTLEVAPVDAAEGEDGRGGQLPASDPVALDLVSPDGFPGRARDPVLHVGQLRFRDYSHPAPDRMRFVVASRALLPEGAEVALQWGDDVASRTVLTAALEVPR